MHSSWIICQMEVVCVVYWYLGFCLTFYLTGIHFWGTLQQDGDVIEQKLKYGPIRTLEITDIRLLHEFYFLQPKVLSKVSKIADLPRVSKNEHVGSQF